MPDSICFTVAFPQLPNSVAAVWRAITKFLREQGCLPKHFEVSQIAGHRQQYHDTKRLRLTPVEVEELIMERNLDGFQVSSSASVIGMNYWLMTAKEGQRSSYLWSIIDENIKAPKNWSGLIIELISIWPSIGAWQWNSLYRSWQCALFLDNQYRTKYGPPPSLIRTLVEKSIDGIRPDRIRIDTSSNPGRAKKLLSDIAFYPTAEMWLGPHFWPYAKCTKQEALAADFWLETRDTPHYTYFKCWPTPFTRPDGEQGRMQQRLWKLFFHEDCEWPPGSGTICNEPRHGPPELLT